MGILGALFGGPSGSSLEDDVVDPGRGKRSAAQGKSTEAEDAWRELYGDIPETPYIQPGDLTDYEVGPAIDPYMIGYGAPGQRGGTAAPLRSPALAAASGGLTPTGGTGAPLGERGAFVTAGGPGAGRAGLPEVDLPGTSAGGLGPGASAWKGLDSAYGGMDPSAYRDWESAFAGADPSQYAGLESSFAGAGPSAYEGLGFDAGAMGMMGGTADYFGDVMQSPVDAIAEADYARRQAEAEQQRRAHTEAALADLEMRGQGGMGNRLLAELSGAQAMTSDLYRAGMDANAIAQARRDAAAGSRGAMGERMGRAQLEADALRAAGLDEREIARLTGIDTVALGRAAGMDEYDVARMSGLDTQAAQRAAGLDEYAMGQAAGQDTFTAQQATGQDTFTNADWDRWMQGEAANQAAANAARTANVQRQQNVGDANVEQWNRANLYNIGAPQTTFGNRMGVTSGYSGALTGSATGLRSDAAQHVSPLDVVSNVVSAGAKAKGLAS